MISRHFVEGNKILFGAPGDSYHCATCPEAEKAAKLLNDARWLNDAKRRYTAAARKINEAENLPGFEWVPVLVEEV